MVENILEKFEGKNYKDEEIENILFNEVIMGERNKFEAIFQDEMFIDFLEELWDSEANMITKKREIFNLALFLNNKVVEIVDFFRRRGISFYKELNDTSVAGLALESVFHKYNDTLKYLENAIDSVRQMDSVSEVKLNVDEFKTIFEQLNRYFINMRKYQLDSDRNVWNYSIEKDIVNDILQEFFDSPDKGKFLKKLSIYLRDLRRLGLNEQINEITIFFSRIRKTEFNDYIRRERDIKGTWDDELAID